jgi:prepilin-type processing-associated H-X9-DG protein
MYADSNVRLTDITDGSSNTVMVGERPPSPNLYWGWWSWGPIDAAMGVRNTAWVYADCLVPDHYRPPNGNGDWCDSHHYWSYHEGGANWLFADGSVRFLTYQANNILPALSTRAGGEVVAVPN